MLHNNLKNGDGPPFLHLLIHPLDGSVMACLLFPPTITAMPTHLPCVRHRPRKRTTAMESASPSDAFALPIVHFELPEHLGRPRVVYLSLGRRIGARHASTRCFAYMVEYAEQEGRLKIFGLRKRPGSGPIVWARVPHVRSRFLITIYYLGSWCM